MSRRKRLAGRTQIHLNSLFGELLGGGYQGPESVEILGSFKKRGQCPRFSFSGCHLPHAGSLLLVVSNGADQLILHKAQFSIEDTWDSLGHL